MPNGESKNWVRFQITLERFYVLYDKWPTVIHLYPFFIEELKCRLSENDFLKIENKIRMIPDDENPFLAYDDDENKFDYCRSGQSKKETDARAIDWLGVKKPSYYD